MLKAMTVGAFKPSFSVRLFGFSRRQVLAFCSQVVDEYERVKRDLEQSRQALHAARAESAEVKKSTATPSQGVERILGSAQRIADEIENDARTQAARLLAEASARAAEVAKEAERNAARIVDDARGEAARCDERAAALRAQYAELRTAFEVAAHKYAELRAAFEVAAHTAASALSEIATLERGTPDTSQGRQAVSAL